MANHIGITMREAIVRTKLRRWGNTFGIAVSRKDVERLHAKAGAEVTARIQVGDASVDFSDAGIFRLGATASRDHEEGAGASVEEERKRWRPA